MTYTDSENIRWMVCAHELDKLAELRSDDEFMATIERTIGGIVTGEPWVVIVLRDGTVTNRTDDDSGVVPEHVRVLIGEETDLFREVDTVEQIVPTLGWLDVTVDAEGNFLHADEASLQNLRGGNPPSP